MSRRGLRSSSQAVFQQEDNAKRAKLASLCDTTLQDLPIELLEYILIKVVATEVKDAKLVKSVWKEKADRVIDRLTTVCSQWSSVLATNFFRNNVHRILEGTAQETVRLEILQQSTLDILALDVTSMKDEVFVLWNDYRDYSINVYDRNNTEAVKTVIPLPGRNPLNLAACSLSNCVYVLDRKQSFRVSVLCIAKDEAHQFSISEVISVAWLPNPTLCVTTSGCLVLSRQRGEDRAVISIYDANGSLQHEMRLSSEISSLWHIIPRSNGNLVLVSLQKDQYKTKLTEIDLQCTILRQYQPSVGGVLNVSHADIHGRMMMTHQPSNRIVVLLDSEFNPLDFTGPELEDEYDLHFPYRPILHYNCERNEIVRLLDTGFDSGVLFLRFTDE